MSRHSTARSTTAVRNRVPDMLGPASAVLLLARFLVPAESAAEGETLWIVVGWLMTAALAAWLAHRAGRFQLRLRRQDVAVVAVCLSQSAAALGVWVIGGDRRAALNMFWEWIGLGAAFVLLRQLGQSAEYRRRLTALLLTTGVVLAGLGLWQWGVWYPQVQASYREWEQLTSGAQGHGPGIRRRIEGLERELGPELLSLQGPSQAALRQRVIDSREPFGRFGLANTLGSILAALLVLSTGCRSAGPPRRAVPLWTVRGLLAAALILTRSRTAWIAALAGLAFVAVAPFARRRGDARWRGWHRPIAWAGLLLVATAAAAIVVGAIDRQEISEAPKSLIYRVQYAAATWRLILDHPLCGVGPGNFRQRYLQYKLPEASEEISDPHNFLLEAAATGGVVSLAAVLWVVVLAARNWRDVFLNDTAGSPTRTLLSTTEPPLARWLALVGVCACVAVFLVTDLFARRTEPQLLWLAAAWLPAAWCVDRVLRHHRDERGLTTSAAAAGLTLTITLLVSGGFSMPTVAILWLTSTFVLCAAPSSNLTAAHDINGGDWGARVAVAVAALLAGCLWTAWGPVTLSHMYRAGGNTALYVERRPDRAVALYQAAAAADPLDPQPWRELSAACAALAQSEGPNADRRFTAAVAAAHEAIRRDPYDAHGYRRLGELWAMRADNPEFPTAAREAAAAWRQAVQHAPHVAALHADLAHALARAGKPDDARREAELALTLNAVNRRWRHFDKTLSLDELAALQQLLDETGDHRVP